MTFQQGPPTVPQKSLAHSMVPKGESIDSLNEGISTCQWIMGCSLGHPVPFCSQRKMENMPWCNSCISLESLEYQCPDRFGVSYTAWHAGDVVCACSPKNESILLAIVRLRAKVSMANTQSDFIVNVMWAGSSQKSFSPSR